MNLASATWDRTWPSRSRYLAILSSSCFFCSSVRDRLVRITPCWLPSHQSTSRGCARVCVGGRLSYTGHFESFKQTGRETRRGFLRVAVGSARGKVTFAAEVCSTLLQQCSSLD